MTVSTAISRRPLLKGTIWTAVSFGAVQILRLLANVALARLLAPELFGIMQIVYSVQTGVELISDVGIGQNIIYHKDANEENFYNSAWSLQLIRSILLWLVFCAVAIPISKFYHSSVIILVMPVAGLAIVLNGFASTSRFLLQKRMQYGPLAAFDSIVALISSTATIALAYFNPTIWALVFGNLVGTGALAIGSHFLLSDVRQRFFISRRYAAQILSFGKWIFFSSIVYFLSMNFDRLYLAKAIPLHLLGVYGIARTLAGMLALAAGQLGNNVVFPFVASHSHMNRRELRTQLAPIRLKFLLVAAFGFAIFASIADLLIGILYDQRYQAAGWMLPILIIGAWFAIIASLNESTLLGIGKPHYSAFGNGGKFVFLLAGLTFAVGRFGVLGGVMVVAFSDLCRYIPVLIGQVRERFSFLGQDVLVTLFVLVLIALCEWLRWALGFGTSFDAFRIEVPQNFLMPGRFGAMN